MMVENDDNLNIPEYFNNEDYTMDLFCSFDKNDFDNFINEIQYWSYKYEYTWYGMNQKIKNEKSAVFMTYFLSPTLLIFDIMDYAYGLKNYKHFILIFRYRFDSSIKFNKKKENLILQQN